MGKLLVNTLGLGGIGIASYFWGKSSASNTQLPLPPASPNSSSPNLPAPYKGGREVGNFDPASIKPQDFYKYGFPGPIHDLENRQEFISCYNRATRNPYWVIEHITKDSIKSVDGVNRKRSIFKEDENIPFKFRNKLRDYFRSGYDRGHQAPAADAKYSQNAMDETFYLSNISPQVGDGFNRDYWAHFEDFSRRLTQRYDNVRIMTGPLFLPKQDEDGKFRVTYEVIGSPPNIAVPTHFFKLVVCENEKDPNIRVGAFVLPNTPIDNSEPLTKFQVPVEALERASGLDLLHKIPPFQQKDLCRETKCEIIVREFPPRNELPALPGK